MPRAREKTLGARRRVFECEILDDSPLELIQVLHTRGWSARTELPQDIHWRCNPAYTGGKIMHSGYHLIDIVLWWLSQRNTIIRRARVSASFERFRFPHFFEGSANHNIERTAAIQIGFYRDDKCTELDCLATFLMTLGGPKGWTRETYFVLTKSQKQLIIEGERGRGVTGGPIVSVLTPRTKASIDVIGAVAGNKEPTHDFLNGLIDKTRRKKVSVGSSHLWSAKIVEAAYVSAINGGVPEERTL